MVCVKPYYTGAALVPCGQCLPCRISRSREWGVRAMHELDSWDSGTFLTLTYSDEFLPFAPNGAPTLVKDHLVNYIKRVRRDIAYDGRKLKYLASGEYGDDYKRPHYHLILFGIHPVFDRQLLFDNWNGSRIDCGTVTYQSCRYVCNYVLTNSYGISALIDPSLPIRPFKLQSQGIGKNSCLSNIEQYSDNLSLSVKGIKMQLPRYYKNLIAKPTLDHVGIDTSCYVPNAVIAQVKEDRKYEGVDPTLKAYKLYVKGLQRTLNLEKKISLREERLKS